MREENEVYFKLIMIKMVITNKIHLENKTIRFGEWSFLYFFPLSTVYAPNFAQLRKIKFLVVIKNTNKQNIS